MLKARTGGYDGRGNLLFDGDYARVDEVLGSDWDNIYAERIVPFEKELSVVAARDMRGNVAARPHQLQTVEDCTELAAQASISKQPLLLTGGSAATRHHLPSITAGTLERTKSVGGEAKLQLAPPVAISAWQKLTLYS